MGTIVFRVKQGEAQFMSSARLLAAERQPEVELASQSEVLSDVGEKVDVDILMFNTGRLGTVRVFMRDGSYSQGVVEYSDATDKRYGQHCLTEIRKIEHTHAIGHSRPAESSLPLPY